MAKGKLWGFLAGLLLGATALISNPQPANAINVGFRGVIHNSKNGIPGANTPVKAYLKRTPQGSTDTLSLITDVNSRYSALTGSFEPDPNLGDTIYIQAAKDTLGKIFSAETKWIINSTAALNGIYDLHLDNPDDSVRVFVPCIKAVKDTSSGFTSSDTLWSNYWLNKNNLDFSKARVDTNARGPPSSDRYWAVNNNFQTLKAKGNQGDSFAIRLEKTRNDSTFYTQIASAIDTTMWDAMKVNTSNSIHNGAFHGDTLYFPQNISVFRDLSLENIATEDSFSVSDNAKLKQSVKNNGSFLSQTGTIYHVIRNASDSVVFNDSTTNFSVNAGQTLWDSSKTWTPTTPGTFYQKDSVSLAGDVNSGNDSMTKTIHVDTKDLELLANTSDTSGVKDNPIKLRSEIKNNGNLFSRTGDIYYTVSDSATGSIVHTDSTKNILLSPGQIYGDSLSWTPSATGTFYVKDSVSLAGDINPGNDSRTSKTKISGTQAVEMSQYWAEAYERGIKIAWLTASTSNNYLWKIFRGENSDTLQSKLIGTVPGNGNSSQPTNWFYDDTCAIGLNWYRLDEVDMSGEETLYGWFSAIARNNREHGLKFKVIGENPTRNIRQLRIEGVAPGETVTSYNLLGQEVGRSRPVSSSYSPVQMEYNTNSTANGTYFYRLKKSNGSSDTKKVIQIK